MEHLSSPGTDEIVAALKEHGAVIVERLVDVELLARLRDELEPLVAAAPFGNDFGGRLTQRVGGLVAVAPASRPLIVHESILAASHACLSPWSKKLLLHLTQAIAINPGQPAQIIHRDRLGWGHHLPRAIEPQINTIWAITDFTADNGATRVVPGSHRWEEHRREQAGELESAVMPAGSVLIYTGSVLHGGGENRSNSCRIGLNIGYCLSWLRQEENQYLACPPRVARELHPTLQDLLGYTMSDHGLGYCADASGALVQPETLLDRRLAPSTGEGLMAYVEAAR